MVLWPKKGAISGIVLFEYLSNRVVKEALRSLAGGAGIQTIAIKDLKAFRIPVPSDQVQMQNAGAFQMREEQFTKLKALATDFESERAATWTHSVLRP